MSCLTMPAMADEDGASPEESVRAPVVDPEIDRRDIRRRKIDTENFELGAYGGYMSIEDFGVNSVVGARLAFHVTEGFFIEASYGQTEAGETSFEKLSGAAQLLTDEQRQFTYYNLSFGYNILPGEVFIGPRRAFNTALYVLVGAGSTEFGGDDRFTVNLGMGYRFFPTDWMAVHMGVRDHLFDIDLLGQDKTAHNMETHLSLTFFF